MNIALAQINLTVGDFEKNALKILNFSWDAFRKGADLIVFPELSLCGYPPEDLLLKKAFIQEEMETLKKMIKGLPDFIVILGLAYPEKNFLYNSAGVIFKRELVALYHKINLPNYGVFDEKRYFEPGKEAMVLQVNESTFGIEICEDIWIENSVSEAQSFSGDAEIILNLSASPYHMGKGNIRQEILKNVAKKTKSQIFYCNLVGGQDELVFDGESMVIDEEGNLIA
ncbi:MAG: nitrilase-related carbon-nitrogen hydrolase, partial [Thermoanaerobaculia bacterium]